VKHQNIGHSDVSQVKCDCIHPTCSECKKRKLLCEYRNFPSAARLSEPDPPVAATNDPGIAASVESSNTDDGPMKKLGASGYSCQFAGDTLSMLTDTDDVCRGSRSTSINGVS